MEGVGQLISFSTHTLSLSSCTRDVSVRPRWCAWYKRREQDNAWPKKKRSGKEPSHGGKYNSCHVRQKFDQSLRETGVCIGDLRSARRALVLLFEFEDASKRGFPLDHLRPGLAPLAIDAVRS